jgi:Chaperone of endosialidase
MICKTTLFNEVKIVIIAILLPFIVNGQVVVKPNLNTYIGDTLANNTFEGKLTVNSIDKKFGLTVQGNLSPAFLYKNEDTYGIFNFLSTTSIPLLTTAQGKPPGRSTIYNLLVGKRNAYHNGVFNELSEEDTTNLFPVEMTGILNNLSNARSIVNGTYNQIIKPKSLEVYGLRNYISTKDSSANFAKLYGLYNDIETGGVTNHYGVYNIIKINQNTQGETYGVRTEIKLADGVITSAPAFNPPVRYGVFSKVDSVLKPGGVTGYSGYFQGPFLLNGIFLQTSDSRLKENVENLKDAVSLIRKLSPKKYNVISEKGGDGYRKHIGLLAQDVEANIPELVYDVFQPTTKETDRIVKVTQKIIEKGLNGEIILKDKIVDVIQKVIEPDKPEKLKAVNYSEMISILLQAVKEQQDIIDQLQKDVDKLKIKVGN